MMRFTPGTDFSSSGFFPLYPTRHSGVQIMEAEAAKAIGAGLAAIGMGAAAIGVGNIFGSFLSGALRNPSAADSQFGRAFIGAALAEGLGIFAFVVALILIFVA
jgi:F-type H+-transporting ATPase subunit c